MKIVISIFILPYEIDDLEQVALRLKSSSSFLKAGFDWHLDVTLCLADDMINWSRSVIPSNFFKKKLDHIEKKQTWCSTHFRTSSSIKGCVSQRRACLKRYSDADYFIWLDPDIVFTKETLHSIEQAINHLHTDYPFTVITPEVVKLWDNSWDCLVNDFYSGQPYGYQANNDPYKDCGIKGPLALSRVVRFFTNEPKFYFSGGWFTCISAKLLNRIGIPEAFGHYGYEDTLLTWACDKLNDRKTEAIYQFKIKNLVICENYKYKSYDHYTKYLTLYDRKEEFKHIAKQAFDVELNNIE